MTGATWRNGKTAEWIRELVEVVTAADIAVYINVKKWALVGHVMRSLK